MRFIGYTVFSLSLVMLGACDNAGTGGNGEPEGAGGSASRVEAPGGAKPPEATISDNVVEVSIEGLTFSMPDEIPSGWTTFRVVNNSAMVHIAIVEKMPEGFGLVEQQAQVAPVFQAGKELLDSGDANAAQQKFGELPPWFGDIEFIGGTGFVAAQSTARTTVNLQPGTYLLECYVVTNGIFHSYNPEPDAYGMVYEFTVTGEKRESLAPEPTLHVTVSTEGGIEIDEDTVEAGEHTVAVYFADQTVYSHFLGHDVHLARIDDTTDLDYLARWMNWMNPEGISTPAPVEFLGGVNELPADNVGYFTATLTPGQYAWIAEVPDPRQKGMLRTFTVE